LARWINFFWSLFMVGLVPTTPDLQPKGLLAISIEQSHKVIVDSGVEANGIPEDQVVSPRRAPRA
jgi:hypothetical protein